MLTPGGRGVILEIDFLVNTRPATTTKRVVVETFLLRKLVSVSCRVKFGMGFVPDHDYG